MSGGALVALEEVHGAASSSLAGPPTVRQSLPPPPSPSGLWTDCLRLLRLSGNLTGAGTSEREQPEATAAAAAAGARASASLARGGSLASLARGGSVARTFGSGTWAPWGRISPLCPRGLPQRPKPPSHAHLRPSNPLLQEARPLLPWTGSSRARWRTQQLRWPSASTRSLPRPASAVSWMPDAAASRYLVGNRPLSFPSAVGSHR